MDLHEAQQEVDRWIRGFREGYWPPLVLLARLTEEVGELAREVNHRFGPKQKKAGEPAQDLALELGDLLFLVLCFANSQGIDMDDAFRRVLDKYRRRDADRFPR